ncbi:MAG: hypothetical protein ACR2IR_09510 [Acidimicrobiia bacterium]
MTRVLNLDLDFFLRDAAHWRGRQHERLDANECPPWLLEEAISFLEDRCGLAGKLPGFVVEHHGELFDRWRSAIDGGRLNVPFHLTHVDAHADLGLGDAGYVYLMTKLLFGAPKNRRYPDPDELADGNWLAFAIACRWVSAMVYVFNDGGGDDLFPYHMQNFDVTADNIELKAIRPEDWKAVEYKVDKRSAVIAHREPLVPIQQMRWDSFATDQPFDVICLAQSPPFTPPEADVIFDEIKRHYVDETAFA